MEHAYHCPICFATWRKCGGSWDTKFVVCSLSLTVSSSCGTVNNVDTYVGVCVGNIRLCNDQDFLGYQRYRQHRRAKLRSPPRPVNTNSETVKLLDHYWRVHCSRYASTLSFLSLFVPPMLPNLGPLHMLLTSAPPSSCASIEFEDPRTH